MLIDTASIAVRVIFDIILSRRTGRDIERELNAHFDNWTEEVTTYNGNTIVLEMESITTRPKYKPERERGGVEKVESSYLFSSLERGRDKPTVGERFSALANEEWISIVRFNIQNGGIEDIRPEGLNLSFITILLGFHEAGRQIRVTETSEVQSDKLEIKIMYQGSMGEYRRELSDSIDLLNYIQDTMERQVIWFLIHLYHAGQGEGSESIWGNKEWARSLGEFLVGGPVDLEALAEVIGEIKQDLENSEELEKR